MRNVLGLMRALCRYFASLLRASAPGPGAHVPLEQWFLWTRPTPATLDEALAMVRELLEAVNRPDLIAGIPPDLSFEVVRKSSIVRASTTTYATYGIGIINPSPMITYTWSDMLADDDRLYVRVVADVLSSDEAIIWVLCHELGEIQRLRAVFAEEEKVTGREFNELVRSTGRLDDGKDNLHGDANAIADSYLREWRARK